MGNACKPPAYSSGSSWGFSLSTAARTSRTNRARAAAFSLGFPLGTIRQDLRLFLWLLLGLFALHSGQDSPDKPGTGSGLHLGIPAGGNHHIGRLALYRQAVQYWERAPLWQGASPRQRASLWQGNLLEEPAGHSQPHIGEELFKFRLVQQPGITQNPIRTGHGILDFRALQELFPGPPLLAD